MVFANAKADIGTESGTNYQTIKCPPGYYATGLVGSSGDVVDNIQGITCKNIFTGDTQNITGPQFGHNGGSRPINPIQCRSADGLGGFHLNSGGTLDRLIGVCRAAGPQSCCGQEFYDAGQLGKATYNDQYYTGGWGNMVTQVSGSSGQNKGFVTKFGWDTRDFSKMLGYTKDNTAAASCIMGNDKSAECSDTLAAGALDKTAIMQNFCSQGSNIFDSSLCDSALNQKILDPTWYGKQKLNWCSQGENFNDQKCKTFCTADTGAALPDGLKESCNALYKNSCQNPAYANYPICSSLLPWGAYPGAGELDKIPGAAQDPLCYFSDVKQYGYKRDLITNLGCPLCVQKQEISIVDAANTNVSNITQKCNVSQGSSPASSAPATTAAPVPGTGVESTGPFANTKPNTASAAPQTAAVVPVTASNPMSNKTKLIIAVIVIAILLICCCSSGGLAFTFFK